MSSARSCEAEKWLECVVESEISVVFAVQTLSFCRYIPERAQCETIPIFFSRSLTFFYLERTLSYMGPLSLSHCRART